MKSQIVFGRGSTQVLGNMPFYSEFATGSALRITDENVEALSGMVSGLNSMCNWLKSTRPSREEIQEISGNYATHEEVTEKAEHASAHALSLANEELVDNVDILNDKIELASGNCFTNDTVVYTSATEFATVLVSNTSGILKTALDDEISDREYAVSAEMVRATDEEKRIEEKFDGLCSALATDISAVSAISDDKDRQINERIDAYQNVFSAVLMEVSGVAYHADEENIFNDFKTALGATYSSASLASGTLYLGDGKTTDLVVSGDFRARGRASSESLFTGDITANNIKADDLDVGDIEADDVSVDSVTTDSVTANDITTTSFFAGSGERQIAYPGGDTITFGEVRASVNPGSKVFEMAPAISYNGGTLTVGKATQADPVNTISIGPGTASHSGSIVIAVTNGVDGMPLVSHGKDTLNIYTSGQENGVFINGDDLPTVIKRHAASKEDLHDEVLSGIENTSGVIRDGIEQTVTQSVDAQLRNKSIELSAYVDEETRKRIDDVQSVRDELPFYLHTSGGVVWGDLIVKDLDVADILYNTLPPLPTAFTDGEKKVDAHVLIRGCTKADLDYITSQEYRDTIIVSNGEAQSANLIYSITDYNLQSFSPIERIDFGTNAVTLDCQFYGSENSLSSITIPSTLSTIYNGQTFASLSALSSVAFSGRTKDEVSSMENYPWDAPSSTVFICEDGEIEMSAYLDSQETNGDDDATGLDVGDGNPTCKLLNAEVHINYGYGRGYSGLMTGPIYLHSDGLIRFGELNTPSFTIEKSGDDYTLTQSNIGDHIPWPDGNSHEAPIISASVGETEISITREGPLLKRNINGPLSHKASLKLYTPSEVLLKLIENNAEPEKIYATYSASGTWGCHWDGSDVMNIISNTVSPLSIRFERESSLSDSTVHYVDADSNIELRIARENPSKKIQLYKAPIYEFTMETYKGQFIPDNSLMLFVAGTGDLISLAQYFEEHNELAKKMVDATLSAQRTAASAYQIATEASAIATEARSIANYVSEQFDEFKSASAVLHNEHVALHSEFETVSGQIYTEFATVSGQLHSEYEAINGRLDDLEEILERIVG